MGYYAVNQFINKYYLLFSSVAILIGLFLVIFGGRQKHIKSSLYIIGTLTGVVCLFFIHFQILITEFDEAKICIVIVLSILVGLNFSFYLSRYANSIFILLGSLIGYFIGMILFTFLSEQFDVDQTVIYYLNNTIILINTLLN